LASDEVKYDIAFIGACCLLIPKCANHGCNSNIGLQVLHSTQELHTDPGPDLVLLESVKVLAVSIFSQFPQTAYKLIPWFVNIGSRRVGFSGGYNVPLETNPFNSWATVLDCGDIPVTS
jgi:hypothetical protein